MKATMINKSGLEPRGRAVLVEPYEPEVQKGVIHIPQNVSEKTMQAESRAIVIAVGNSCWADEAEPRAVPGDKVMVTKYAGMVVRGTADGKLYRMVNANDIFLRITHEVPVIEEAA